MISCCDELVRFGIICTSDVRHIATTHPKCTLVSLAFCKDFSTPVPFDGLLCEDSRQDGISPPTAIATKTVDFGQGQKKTIHKSSLPWRQQRQPITQACSRTKSTEIVRASEPQPLPHSLWFSSCSPVHSLPGRLQQQVLQLVSTRQS